MQTKAEFNWVFQLLQKRGDFLRDKHQELGELFRLCDNQLQRNLVSSILERFFFLDGKGYGVLLAKMAQHIKTLGYPVDKMVVVAMAIDNSPDSSQEVLQNLKVYLAREFDEEIKLCNNMSDLKGWYNKGYRHFIAVDEFVGSGQTVRSRYRNVFKKINTTDKPTIDFCILTGLEKAVVELRSDSIPIKVFKLVPRGISDFYFGDALALNIDCMLSLEAKLADSINKLRLSDHSLGYHKSEAIYCKENGNIPNNVFPIFWWKKYKNNSKRKTLFTRVQNGY